MQEYASHVKFEMTSLPNLRLLNSFDQLKKRLNQQGLPTNPIIGEDEDEVAARIVEVARAISEFKISDFPGKGSARASFVVSPKSEYDFQDLFWIVTKPLIENISRETVEIVFDGQKKKSDFSLMNSRFIVEMKFAKGEDDKREIAKTLDGLQRFYGENANVRFLLFIIYARKQANIDRVAWEQRYSQLTSAPKTVLRILNVD